MLMNISTAQLRQLVRLSERKEALLAQIQRIDRQMGRIHVAGGDSASSAAQPEARRGRRRSGAASAKTPAGRRGRRRRVARGALKEKITTALKSAGRKGMTVRDLSKKLGVRPGNLYVWFNSTGKKVPGLKKIAPATYRLG